MSAFPFQPTFILQKIPFKNRGTLNFELKILHITSLSALRMLGLRSTTGVFWLDLSGQHLEAWQEGCSSWAPLGQPRAQLSSQSGPPAPASPPAPRSSGPARGSRNSGWMVVEWMPSLWKNSLMFSATCKKKKWKSIFYVSKIKKGFLPISHRSNKYIQVKECGDAIGASISCLKICIRATCIEKQVVEGGGGNAVFFCLKN